MEVHVDIKRWNSLIDSLKPSQQVRLINGYINRMLYAAREDVIEYEMKNVFKNRTKGLFRKHFMYEKCRNMIGYFGSIRSIRFTGWREQQFGYTQERHINISTKGARGKAGEGILKRKFRRDQLGKGLIPVFGKLKTEKMKYWKGDKKKIYPATFSILKHKGYTGPVYIPEDWTTESGNTIYAGIYDFMKTKMKIQSYDIPKEPKKINWASIVLKKFIIKWSLTSDSVLESELNKILKVIT